MNGDDTRQRRLTNTSRTDRTGKETDTYRTGNKLIVVSSKHNDKT